MKHLLRKLHIGGAINDHQRLPDTQPVANPSATANPLSSSSSSSSSNGRIAAVESPGGDRIAAGDASGMDFNLLEEEFQVQLALAISASDPDTREDPESAQIDAAKRISLGCPVARVTVTDSPVESLSLRYWSYNVVNYNDKVMDGFYDVYGITSNSAVQVQGKMPLLMDLQAISILDNIDYEVVLVNRFVDPELRELERKAYMMSLESRVSDGMLLSGMIQKLADLVVDRMGGPVGDADEISTRWTRRSYELRNALNSIIIPLGRLDVGLSRHRALLFKVLADRINLPCMLVKGSYYTGTDDGAINLIKINNESEYIIDLMGAPGILIPAEVPSSLLASTGFDVRGFADLTGIPKGSSLAGEEPRDVAVSSNLDRASHVGSSRTEEALSVGIKSNEPNIGWVGKNQAETFGHEFGKGFPSSCISHENSSGTGRPSAAENIKVKNVSKHALSLISLTTEDPLNNLRYDSKQGWPAEGPAKQKRETEMDFFKSDASFPSDNTSEGFVVVKNRTNEKLQMGATAVNSCQLQPEDALVRDDKQSVKLVETFNGGLHMSCNGYSERIHPVLGEVAEWEIPWEDLQIGERIGIGSYGEVYHADWNGTEVAVKKFLDQDLSGDALVQFKCEAEIMLRLRHPNVVLFMGAVACPPHLSILTEFLPRGSLYRLLHRPNPQLDEKRRMRMALDVAKGMNYLHTSHPPIVHRDLKSPNLLVDKNWVVKVSDFGLSRMKHHTFLSSKSTAGTPEWMAPEVLRNEPANEKCDVYSFGVILWELATCQIPWKGLNPMQVVGAVGFQNKRLEIPEDVDPAIAQIIHDCWQRNGSNTPSETECPVPLDQQPINEYQNLSTSFPFSWAADDFIEYSSRLFVVGAAFVFFVGLPVAWFGSVRPELEPLKPILAALSSGILVVSLAVVRMYLGWAYVGNRLLSATVEYEETGWYDGQIWVKTSEVLARDRLLGSFSVKPVLSRLKYTLLTLATSLFVCILLFINVGEAQKGPYPSEAAKDRAIPGVYNDDSARSFEPDAFCGEPKLS
ncbi:hypothetical protein GH714_030305 [Hevea brasiliensis]|uniref:non-specific serine/threonine protein kinase n=1 Tax=Hevea brasiliensis TaxID=3981 RepID=A0A6A6LWC5_HEVBR|nr:hypothetical protein GH714_030305 [Hevea brasiliensis]